MVETWKCNNLICVHICVVMYQHNKTLLFFKEFRLRGSYLYFHWQNKKQFVTNKIDMDQSEEGEDVLLLSPCFTVVPLQCQFFIKLCNVIFTAVDTTLIYCITAVVSFLEIPHFRYTPCICIQFSFEMPTKLIEFGKDIFLWHFALLFVY